MSENLKLKVGLVFDDSLDSADGVAQYVKTLGGWLSAQNHDVRYLAGQTQLASWQGGKVYSLAKNQTVYFNGNKLSIPLPANWRRLKTVLDKEKFDVLHVMMPHSPFMAQRLVDLADNQTAVVGTFHIFPSGRLAKFGGQTLRLMYLNKLRRFDAVISVSSAAQTYAKQTFKLQTEVIPNPVDLAKFSKTTQKPVQGRVVFMGRLVKRKGVQQLLEAFARVAQKRPDSQLIIAGDGPQRDKLQTVVKKLAIVDRVEFKGFISEEDKADLLASAEVACFPSLYGESFGIVLIEAMAAGARTVLGGNNPGYSSVLSQKPDLLVDPRNTNGFAKRLEQLLTDQDLSDELHIWQQAAVKEYDIKIVGSDILNLYREVIAKRTKTSHNK